MAKVKKVKKPAISAKSAMGWSIGAELMMGAPVTEAVGRGAMFGLWQLASPGTLNAWVLGSIVKAGAEAVNGVAKKATDDLNFRRYNPNPTFTNNFGYNPNNQQAATMRQSAVQAIQGSKLNARNALGNEASLQHRAYY